MSDAPPFVCFQFFAHHSYRLCPYDFFQIGEPQAPYFDLPATRQALDALCETSYLPALDLFTRLHACTEGRFSAGLGISSTLIQQLRDWRPDVLRRFQEVVALGALHPTGGLGTDSLVSVYSSSETSRQILSHKLAIEATFGVTPTVFANTALLYRDDLAPMVRSYGYDTILAEGIPDYLGYRSSSYLYHSSADPELAVLLRHQQLSEDLRFRFSDPTWDQFPLTAQRMVEWMLADPAPVRNLFLDLETLGGHQPADTGIFSFLDHLVNEGTEAGLRFCAPDVVRASLSPCEGYSSPKHSSWAGDTKDKTVWHANVMQQEYSQKLFRLQQSVESANDPDLYQDWAHLQSADHALALSTIPGHKPAHLATSDPYMDYSYQMNILADLQLRAKVASAQAMHRSMLVSHDTTA